MPDRIAALLAQGPVLADAAYGTALLPHVQLGERVEQLNLRAPALVRALAEAYVAAGARVLWSNTFGVGLPGFPASERSDAMRAGVTIARAAAGDTRAVFAALGPMACDMDEFATLLRIAREAGADALVLETMTRVPEALTWCAACTTEGMPVAVSYTVQLTDDGALRTLDGVALIDAARRAKDAGAFSVGVNCCDGPATVLDAVRALHDAGLGPILARPNAGVPEPAEAEAFATALRALADAGAWLVGGCCGTKPAHIAAAARALALR